MGRRTGHATLASTLAAMSHYDETRDAGRRVVDRLVLDTNGSMPLIAERLGVSRRAAQRALAAYGWTQPTRGATPPAFRDVLLAIARSVASRTRAA